MISAKRLSKIIQERESKIVQNHLLELYSCLTPEQRTEIREMLNKPFVESQKHILVK